MGNLLTLYTFWNDLTWEEIDGESETPLLKSSFTLRTGDTIILHILPSCPFEEEEGNKGPIYIISGGYIYEDFTTQEDGEKFFLELQKKPERIYESTGEF